MAAGAARAQTQGTRGEQHTATHAKPKGKPGRDATRDGQGNASRVRQGKQGRHDSRRDAPRAEQPNNTATQAKHAKAGPGRRAARRERQRAANADRDAGRAKQDTAGTRGRNRGQRRPSGPTGQQPPAPQAVQAVQATPGQTPQFSIAPVPSGEPGSFTFTIRVLNGQPAPRKPAGRDTRQPASRQPSSNTKENDQHPTKQRRKRPRCHECNKYGHRRAACPELSAPSTEPAPTPNPSAEVSVVAAPAEPEPGETLVAGRAEDAETATEQALLNGPDDVPMDTGDLEEESTILEGMDTLIINPSPNDRAME